VVIKYLLNSSIFIDYKSFRLADECMFPVVYVPAESMITYIIQTKYLNYNFYLFI